MRPRSVALRPNSPKDTLAPRVATPVFRPFCSLRYLRRAGCSMLFYSLGGAGAGRGHLAHALGSRLAVRTQFGRTGFGRGGIAARTTVGTRARAGTTTVRARATGAAGTRTTARAAIIVLGLGLGSAGRVTAAQVVTPIHPDLDADDAVGGFGFREAVVDVGTQGVKRHAAFAVPLATRDLDAVEPARRHDLDAQGAQAHRVLHRALHGAAEHDALLELLGYRVGDQLRIDFGLAHLFDVHGHRHAQTLGQFGLEVLDVLALLADHHARTRRVDGDAGVLGGALDQDARDGGVLELLLEVLAHVKVFGEHAREVAARCVPA